MSKDLMSIAPDHGVKSAGELKSKNWVQRNPQVATVTAIAFAVLGIAAAGAAIFLSAIVPLAIIAVLGTTVATIASITIFAQKCSSSAKQTNSTTQSSQTSSTLKEVGPLSSPAKQTNSTTQSSQTSSTLKEKDTGSSQQNQDDLLPSYEQGIKNMSPPPPTSHLSEVLVPSKPLPPFDASKYRVTKKMFELAVIKEMPNGFIPLSPTEVNALLKLEPSLQTLDAAQKTMKADVCILGIHTKGIPWLHNRFPVANEELMNSMQFILFTINQETDLKKKQALLLELAGGLEDCVPVTQGNVSKMYMKLAGMGDNGFNLQIDSFISSYKDRIVDEIINELYPGMQDPKYAAQNSPWMQFPHMRTGFVAVLGQALGLNMAGAATDPNRNTKEPDKKGDQFLELFHAKFSIPEMIKQFIIDVNGRTGQIDLGALGFWCTPENVGEEIAVEIASGYEKSLTYPSYSPALQDQNDFAAYLTERAAYRIFEVLGFIES